MTNRFMHGWTQLQPSILFPSSSQSQCLEMFLSPPAPHTCHYIYPCALLSANTFTFLVLLSNKRGGMRGDLLTLLKQTSWTHSAEDTGDPAFSFHSSQSTQPHLAAAPQCMSTVLRFESPPPRLHLLPSFTGSLNKCPPHPGVSTSEMLATQVPG